MRKRTIHHPRTFFFRPGETVTVKVAARTRHFVVRLRAGRGERPGRASSKTLVYRMPKDGVAIAVAELDVKFTGRLEGVHTLEVTVRGSRGGTHKHHIAASVDPGRWTYRLIAAEPRSRL